MSELGCKQDFDYLIKGLKQSVDYIYSIVYPISLTGSLRDVSHNIRLTKWYNKMIYDACFEVSEDPFLKWEEVCKKLRGSTFLGFGFTMIPSTTLFHYQIYYLFFQKSETEFYECVYTNVWQKERSPYFFLYKTDSIFDLSIGDVDCFSKVNYPKDEDLVSWSIDPDMQTSIVEFKHEIRCYFDLPSLILGEMQEISLETHFNGIRNDDLKVYVVMLERNKKCNERYDLLDQNITCEAVTFDTTTLGLTFERTDLSIHFDKIPTRMQTIRIILATSDVRNIKEIQFCSSSSLDFVVTYRNIFKPEVIKGNLFEVCQFTRIEDNWKLQTIGKELMISDITRDAIFSKYQNR